MYLNKAIVIGNLTRDPELKALPSGVKVCTFSLATNRVWKDQATGARKEAVDYHNVVVFNRQAETSAQYLKKGSNALVEGRMQTRSWDNQEGKKMYRTEIVADHVQFGPRPSGPGSGADTAGMNAGASVNANAGTNTNAGTESSSSPAAGSASAASNDAATIEYPEEEINPDDIPF
jgi:single-strand DNA-binding protein